LTKLPRREADIKQSNNPSRFLSGKPNFQEIALHQANRWVLTSYTCSGFLQNFYVFLPKASIMKILVVEDESELSKSIVTYLKAESYSCEIATDFRTALQKTELFDYDCILLDITLPDGNGLQVLKELKANKKTDGVIIISARDSIDDRILGLNLGADDYLSKPFHLSELSARIAAVIRRRRFAGNRILSFNELSFDTAAKTVMVADKVVDLTRTEYDLLLYLVTNKNRVVSKNAIAEHISRDEAGIFGNFDFIYAHMKNLKRKLAAAGSDDYIKAIYGMGYKFEI
jgi:DNA-binding response OmpR family regulator